MHLFDDLESLSLASAELFASLCSQSVADTGRFNVALSGGSTPKRTFQLLASTPYLESIDWEAVHVFWSDERYVPPTDGQSNEGMARAALIDHVPIPADNVHGMYRLGGVEMAARAYEELLKSELGGDVALDLAMLGVGPDGHTASLFPGEPAVHEKTSLVIAGLGHAGVAERITMTPPMINRSKTVLFLVAGADKAEPMRRILSGPENWDLTPAQAVARHAPNVIWLLERAAAPA